MEHYSIIKRVSIVYAFTNLLLSIFKVVIGYWSASQALIADGLHSFSDLLSDGLVLLAAKLGSKRPDKEHPYGHQRIETITVTIIAVMLMIVGLGIIYENTFHIIHSTHSASPNLPTILVATFSVFANEWLYHYGLKASKKIESKLLKSNAWHKRTDALVSLVVLVSIAGTYFGIPHLDAITAIIIGVLI